MWSLLEPIDRRLLRCDYSDVLLLGKTFTRGHSPMAGWLRDPCRKRRTLRGWRSTKCDDEFRTGKEGVAIAMALGEHVALYPFSYFVDRYHPARGQAGIRLSDEHARLRAGTRFGALFGALLGRLSR